MSNMSVVVEFTVGTSILEAVIEAKEKAVMWGIYSVNFNFNGVKVYVSNRQNNLDIEEEWVKCCKNKDTILFL